MMKLFKMLVARLKFDRARVDLPPQSFNELTLSQLLDIYQRAWGSSPLEAKARAELRNRQGTLDEWIAIYSRSYICSWAEDLALRRIRQASATYDEWYRLFLSFPPGTPLKKIAKKKLDSTSRS